MKISSGHRLTVYLPKPLFSRLKTQAKSQKVTLGKIVRERLAQEELTAFEELEDLVGSVASGVSDLSHSPKHLEGFGK